MTCLSRCIYRPSPSATAGFHVFQDVGDAELYLEPIDVEKGERETFDAEGQELALTVVRTPVFGWRRLLGRWEERVRITLSTPGRPRGDRLRELLLRDLEKGSRSGAEWMSLEEAACCPLAELVEAAADRSRRS